MNASDMHYPPAGHTMQYMVCQSFTAPGLWGEVHTLLLQGWEPTGGVSVGPSHTLYQAMIKRPR